MRLIVQPMAGGFELCARLGLVLAEAANLTQEIRFGIVGQFVAMVPLRGFEDGKVVNAVLEGSPSARGGIHSRDIILAINDTSWREVRLLTFSDHRPSKIIAKTFVADQFAVMDVVIRVPPHHYRPLAEIQKEVADIVAARPTLDAIPYRNRDLDPDPKLGCFLANILSSHRRGNPRLAAVLNGHRRGARR
jgi:hypothetical protein